MKSMQRNRLWLLGLLLTICYASTGFADQELQAPQVVIENTAKELKQRIGTLAQQGNIPETMQIVDEVLTPHVDQHRVAALALGKYWKKATPDERAAFEQEYKNTMIRLYSSAYASYKDWNIIHQPLKLKPDAKKAIVKIKVDRSEGQPVDMSYRMVNKSGDWKVYDIIIEGISLVSNYRSQFTEIIDKNKGSIKALIEHLAEKNREALKRINSSA